MKSEKAKSKKNKKKGTKNLPAIPVNVAEMLEQAAKEAAAKEVPSTASFQTRGGILSFGGTPVPDNKMECIILSAVWENSWFDSKFDSKNPRSPACFAMSTTGVEMGPHNNSLDPRSDLCEDCEFNEWESDPNPNSRAKACKQVRRLAILPVDALEVDDLEDLSAAKIAMLRLPVTSVKNWSNYVNLLAAKVKRPPYGVITEVSLVADANTQFKIEFKPVEPLTDTAEIRAVMDQIERSTNMIMAPYSMAEAKEKEERPRKKKRRKEKF